MKLNLAILVASMAAYSLCAQSLKVCTEKHGKLEDGDPTTVTWAFDNAPTGTRANIEIRAFLNGAESWAWGYNLTEGGQNPPSGKLLWTPRAFPEAADTYKIEVTWYRTFIYEPIATATSDEFTIKLKGPRSIVLTYPEADISIPAGGTTWFRWDSRGLPANAKILVWLQPADNTEAGGLAVGTSSDTGGYFWTVPGDLQRKSYVSWLFYVNEYGINAAAAKGPMIRITD